MTSTEQAFQAAVAKGMWDGLGMPPRVVLLPWPDKTLSQNARVHWARKAKATRSARLDACWYTVIAMSGKKPRRSGARLHLTFNPPDRRKRDLQNCIGSAKALVDGIADALDVDDSLFSMTYAMGEPVKGGSVRVEIRPL